MTTENNAKILRIVLTIAGLILTAVLTLFADRLVREHQEVTAQERIETLRRDMDEVKSAFIRKEAIEPRLQAIEKAIIDFDRRQEKIFDTIQAMARQGRKEK